MMGFARSVFHPVRAGLSGLALAAVLAGGGQMAAAQEAWPQRTVKFILPFGAGGAIDVAARAMAEKLSERWGKPVVIENRPGADGLLAIGGFVTANDDHVLLYASSASFNAHPYMHEKLPYDFKRDLMPIARLTDTTLSVAVPAALPVKSLNEFVALAKADPGKLNVAGAPGLADFAVDYFLKKQNLNLTKIPYRDITQAASHLATNQIQFAVSAAVIMRGMVSADKVRILAVTSRARSPFFPDAPTVYEAGYPELGVDTTAGLYGPKTMPAALRERIAKDVLAVAADPSITERIVAGGQTMNLGGPDDLEKTINEQAAQMSLVAKTLGLKSAVP